MLLRRQTGEAHHLTPHDSFLRGERPGFRRRTGQKPPARGEGTPPVPVVDFSRRMVVVVSMGLQPTSGYTIEVTRLTLLRGSAPTAPVLRVNVREVRPRGCFELPSVTGPIHVIETSLLPDVTFLRTLAFTRCRR